MKANALADRLVSALRRWNVPPVKSERDLDLKVRDFLRLHVVRLVPQLRRLPPERRPLELMCCVAGHGGPKQNRRCWTASKPYQNVRLWGSGKTADLFVYDSRGKYGLPRRGISVEIKYIPRGASYAGAIATVAGQLLAYSLRHVRTIGFVLCEERRRDRIIRHEGDEDRSEAFLKALPRKATLIVRFRRP